MINSTRAARIHDATAIGCIVVLAGAWLLSGRSDVAILCCAVAWVPSMVVRFIDREWWRAGALAVALAVIVGAVGASIALDRATTVPRIFSP